MLSKRRCPAEPIGRCSAARARPAIPCIFSICGCPARDWPWLRIRDRVDAGGHDVPAVDVRRRYPRSIRNFFDWYAPVVDTIHFFDNSGNQPRLVFVSEARKTSVLDKILYEAILKSIRI